MATKTRAQLIAQGQEIKTETTDGANTAARVGLAIEETAENSFNLNTDNISTISGETTSQLDDRDTANRGRANHTGTQAASTISDFNSSVDARVIPPVENLGAGAQELTFDRNKVYLIPAGSTVTLSLASSGNVHGAVIQLLIDQGTVNFPAGSINEGSLVNDNTKYQRIWITYDNSGKMYYIIKHSAGLNDITAPTFTAGPTSQNVAETTAEVTFTINETGDVFAVVVADGATAPTPAEVIAGTGSGGSGQVDTDSVLANTTGTLSFTGLTASTAYDIYVVARDDEGTPNVQASATKVDITTTSAFTDAVSRLLQQGQQHYTNESIDLASQDFTISFWAKGVNFVKGTNDWYGFAPQGSGDNAPVRFVNIASVNQGVAGDSFTLELNDSTSRLIQFKWNCGTQLTDGNWHLYWVEYDYTNKTAALYIDNVLQTLQVTADGAGFDKTAVNTGQYSFRASNASGGDLWDDGFIILSRPNSTQRGNIYNSGTPIDVTTQITPILYQTLEDNSMADVMGNYTFTENTAGGSFSSDTPTNPA